MLQLDLFHLLVLVFVIPALPENVVPDASPKLFEPPRWSGEPGVDLGYWQSKNVDLTALPPLFHLEFYQKPEHGQALSHRRIREPEHGQTLDTEESPNTGELESQKNQRVGRARPTSIGHWVSGKCIGKNTTIHNTYQHLKKMKELVPCGSDPANPKIGGQPLCSLQGLPRNMIFQSFW